MSREGDRESGHEHSLRGQMEGNSGLWFAEALLVVVILMATVAFQARLNPPGGVWQETGHHNLTADSPMQYSHKAGQSTLWDVNKYRYRWFAISNDITLSLSLLAIQLLLARSFFKSGTNFLPPAIISAAVALVCMSVTYVASAVSVAPDDTLQYYTCALVLCSSPMLFLVVWKLLPTSK